MTIVKIATLAVTAAVAGCVVATPALAANRVFEACDGRKAPGSRDGGMADPVAAAMPGEAPVIFADRVRGGGDLVAACTTALADPRLTGDMELRRAHLLRARALARLANGDGDGAIADVDAAGSVTEALAADPLYARSMGLSLTLIRAAALDLKGEHDRADAMAAEAARGRPYSVAIQSAAALIRRHARDAAGRDAAEVYAGVLPLDPLMRKAQFGADMAAGRFAAALVLYPLLDTATPPPGPMSRPDEMPALLGPVSNGIQAAYAGAATGRPAEARALLAAIRERVTRAFAAPAIPGKDEAQRAALATVLSRQVNAGIDQWGTMIEARAAIDEGHPLEALKALVGAALPVSAASVDLLTALRAALPPAQKALAPDPALLAARLAEARRDEKLNVALLRRAMPAPETSRSLAGYGKASSGFLSGLLPVVFSADGFASHDDATAGTTTVEFTGRASSAPVVDELTLLRAADLARAAGRSGLVIVSRSDYARTMNTYMGYGHTLVASNPAGFKTVLTVRFLDAKAPPADDRARVIDADRVYAALAPVYIKR